MTDSGENGGGQPTETTSSEGWNDSLGNLAALVEER